MKRSRKPHPSVHNDTPKDKQELAVNRFLQSMNCAQAVVETYAVPLSVPEETARRVAAAFAGGMGMGSVCGAVAGAFMVIGMKYGKTKPNDRRADQRTFKKVSEFIKEFKNRHQCLDCSRLLGVDMSTAKGVKEAERKGHFTKSCPAYVRSAVQILDKILSV